MGNQTHVPGPEMLDLATTHHYHELMEQSSLARARGDHWAAQKLATAAHKWAMDEHTRLQRLAVARDSLVRARKRLEATNEVELDGMTAAELRERYPEFKPAIAAWEKAEQLVRELESPPGDQETSK